MLGGVCGGLGQYLNLDPTVVRLFFLLLIFGSDFGFLLYILVWIVVPEKGREVPGEKGNLGERFQSMGDDIQHAVTQPHPQAGVLVGAGLVIMGGILFLERLDLPWLVWLDMDIIWPMALILGGIALLVRQLRQ